MPQLHFYVPEAIAEWIRQESEAAGLPVSRYLAEIVKREFHPEWPPNFFDEVVGGWQGGPLERPEQDAYDAREPLLFRGN